MSFRFWLRVNLGILAVLILFSCTTSVAAARTALPTDTIVEVDFQEVSPGAYTMSGGAYLCEANETRVWLYSRPIDAQTHYIVADGHYYHGILKLQLLSAAGYPATGYAGFADALADVTEIPGCLPPAAPTNLQATAISAREIRLDWTSTSRNEAGFVLYDGLGFTNLPASPTTYTVTVPANSYRCFALYGFNRFGASSWTPYSCATSLSPTWTLMYYLAGDNSLDGYHKALLERFKKMSRPNFNIAVMYDGQAQGDSVYYAMGDNISFIKKGELDSGNVFTLVNFVDWARTTLPARYTALVISDHGALVGTAEDDTSHTRLSTMDLGSAMAQITAHNGKVDVLFLNSCLMGTLEVGYQVRGFADYLVASENVFYADYERGDPNYISGITYNQDPSTLASNIVDTVEQRFLGLKSPLAFTISAVRLNNLSTLIANANTLSSLLKTQMPSIGNTTVRSVLMQVQHFDSDGILGINMLDEMIDLYDFAQLIRANVADPNIQNAAQAVMTALRDDPIPQNRYVLKEHHFSGKSSDGTPYQLDHSNGVAIFFPGGFRSFYSTVNLDFAAGTVWQRAPVRKPATAQAAIEWGPMLVEYVKATNPNPVDNPSLPPLMAPLDFASNYAYLPAVSK